MTVRRAFGARWACSVLSPRRHFGLHSLFWQATERWLSLTLSAALIFGQPTFTLWSDVSHVQRRQHCLALERRAGSALRISFSLYGLQDFARLSLNSVPQARIEPEARDVIQRMAAGELPES